MLRPLFLIVAFATASIAVPPRTVPGTYDAAPSSAVRLLYQYPKGQWIENIAVRESGELLLTLLYSPHLDQLSPNETKPQPRTVAQFPGYSGLSGITEIQPDVFAVGVGNASSSAGPVLNSWSLWRTDFKTTSGQQPTTAKITGLSDLQFPNGITSLPSTKLPENVLTSDVKTGKIWKVNTTNGQHKVVIDNQLTAAVSDPVYGPTGTDGIRTQGTTLYFANAGTGVFASIPIKSDGTPAGPPKEILRVNESTSSLDDFAVRGNYAYLVNARGNSVLKASLDGTNKVETIAGNINSTQIAQPTSCAFGRTALDSHILYVVTAGGLAIPVNGNETVGAQVLAIDTAKLK